MRKFLSIFVLAFLSTNAQAYTPINPQPGDSTWDLLKKIGTTIDETSQCVAIPVSNVDAKNGDTITLDTPGYYCCIENITKKILITSSGIALKLNNYTVSRTTPSENIITVSPGTENIVIFNGSISNTDVHNFSATGAGILVSGGASKISLAGIKIFGCGNGISFAGVENNEVVDCEIIAVDLVSNTTGIVLTHADENCIKQCTASHCTQAGFELLNSERNSFFGCSSLGTFGDTTTAGFKTTSGTSNLFKSCIAKGTKTSSWKFCNKAYGFFLTGTESKTKIIDCIVNETDVTSTVSAVTYGIHLDPSLLEYDKLLNGIDAVAAAGNISSVAWSPNSQYIAVSENVNSTSSVKVFWLQNNKLQEIASGNASWPQNVAWSPCGNFLAAADSATIKLFRFDGSQLTFLSPTIRVEGDFATDVAWSPNGKYLAAGDGGGYIHIVGFDGDKLAYLDKIRRARWVNSIDWSPDGQHIISACIDEGGEFLVLYEFTGSKLIKRRSENWPSVNYARWSPTGTFIAACSGAYTRIYSFDGTSLTFSGIQDSQTPEIYSLEWAPNGKYLATIRANSQINLFNFDGLALTHMKTQIFSAQPSTIDWSSCGRFIATGDVTNKLLAITAMNSPQYCLINNCKVCDTTASGQFVGTGIAGGGNSSFLSNACCNNGVNFSYGVPNVFYGDHSKQRPFDNISMPTIP